MRSERLRLLSAIQRISRSFSASNSASSCVIRARIVITGQSLCKNCTHPPHPHRRHACTLRRECICADRTRSHAHSQARTGALRTAVYTVLRMERAYKYAKTSSVGMGREGSNEQPELPRSNHVPPNHARVCVCPSPSVPAATSFFELALRVPSTWEALSPFTSSTSPTPPYAAALAFELSRAVTPGAASIDAAPGVSGSVWLGPCLPSPEPVLSLVAWMPPSLQTIAATSPLLLAMSSRCLDSGGGWIHLRSGFAKVTVLFSMPTLIVTSRKRLDGIAFAAPAVAISEPPRSWSANARPAAADASAQMVWRCQTALHKKLQLAAVRAGIAPYECLCQRATHRKSREAYAAAFQT